MKLFFTFLLCFSIGTLFSQIYNSSCTATLQIERLYRNDVYKCANTRVLNINSTYKDSIDIPAIYRDSIARVFYAIQNMTPSTLKDTIIHLFGFTNFNSGNSFEFIADSLHFSVGNLSNLSVKSIEMYVSNTIPWANQWAAGNYNNTSDPQINELVNKYQLSITTGTGLPGTYYFKAKAGFALNTTGLAKKFNEIINSATACTPVRYIGDGNSVTLNYQTDGIQITYSNRCGDCLSGCQWGRRWIFKVYYNNCNVEYVSAENFGFPLPPGSTIYTCTGTIVPVTFGSISGYLQSGKAALNWKVLTQINVKEYVIERSDNGQLFYTAGTVVATNSLTADYTWKDVGLLTGTAWYRIKAVDLDGKFKYSSIIKITGASKANSFTVYPNPVVNKSFTIQFGSPLAGQTQAGLYSIAGKKVWATTLSLAPQTVSHTLLLPAAVPPGVYALVVENNGTTYKQVIVVKGE